MSCVLTGAALGLFMVAASVAAIDPRDDTMPALLMLFAAAAAFAAMLMRKDT